MISINVKGMTFTSDGNSKDGKIISGSANYPSSLSCDEIKIGSIKFTIRTESIDVISSLMNGLAGYELSYKDDNSSGTTIYIPSKVERIGKNVFTIYGESRISGLKNYIHYGGLYNGRTAYDVLGDIFRKTSGFSSIVIDEEELKKQKLYGYLPICSSLEAIKQVLFVCGGTMYDDYTTGQLRIKILKETSPYVIPDNRVYDSGKVSFDDSIKNVEVVEHEYSFKTKPIEEIYNGPFVSNVITFKKPYSDLEITGARVIESSCNHCVVDFTFDNIVIKGYEIVDNTFKRYYNSSNVGDKSATVKDCTLITSRNSNVIADRVFNFYNKRRVLETAFIAHNEKTLDAVRLKDPFGDVHNGYIQDMDVNFSNNIIKKEAEIVLDFTPPLSGTKVPEYIQIATPPKKTNYKAGELFDATGMTVKVKYRDIPDMEYITNYTYYPTGALTVNDDRVVVYYTEAGVTVSTDQPIKITDTPMILTITKKPDKMKYEIGEVFDSKGIMLRATYGSGNFKLLKEGNYTYSPTGPLTNEDRSIIFSYTENNVTITTKLDILFGDSSILESIKITKNPDRMKYGTGDVFNPQGMEITGYFKDGSSKLLNTYTWSPDGPLVQGQDVITVTVEWLGKLFKDTLKIDNPTITKVEIISPPNRDTYYEGEYFDPLGVQMKITFSNGNTEILDSSSITTDKIPLKYTDTKAILKFTFDGQEYTHPIAITVNYTKHEYTKSKVIVTDGQYTGFDTLKEMLPDATHRDIRIMHITTPETKELSKYSDATPSTGENTLTVTSADGIGEFILEGGTSGWAGKSSNGANGGSVYTNEVVIPAEDSSISLYGGNDGDSIGFSFNTYENNSKDIEVLYKNYKPVKGPFKDIFTDTVYARKGEDGIEGRKGGNPGEAGNDYDTEKLGGKAGNATSGVFDTLRHVDTYEATVKESDGLTTETDNIDNSRVSLGQFNVHNRPGHSDAEVARYAQLIPHELKISGYTSIDWDPKTGIITPSGHAEWGIFGKGKGHVYPEGSGSVQEYYLYPDTYIDNGVSKYWFGSWQAGEPLVIDGFKYCLDSGFRTIVYTNIQNPTSIPEYGTSVASCDCLEISYPDNQSWKEGYVVNKWTKYITREKKDDDVYEVTIKWELNGGGGGGASYQYSGGDANNANGGNAATIIKNDTTKRMGDGPDGTSGRSSAGAGAGGKIIVTQNREGAINKVNSYSYTLTGGKPGEIETGPLGINYGGPSGFIIYYS